MPRPFTVTLEYPACPAAIVRITLDGVTHDLTPDNTQALISKLEMALLQNDRFGKERI